MNNYFVIGNPIVHSLSPVIHNHWFRKYNIEGHYEKRKLEKLEKINKRKLKKMKKPVKKDASIGSVKINCDSPVWKNKPKCN